MEKIQIRGSYRDKAGKGVARRLRREGKIPAVIYSKGHAKPLILNQKEVDTIRHSTAGENAIITLEVLDEKEAVIGTHLAILRDFQKDPLTGQILHADLFEISMKDEIGVKVMVEIVGSVPIGVKRDNGVLRHHLRELEVRCMPSDIPDHIQIDASHLGVGDIIHVKDIPLPKGVKVLDPPEQALVSITATISEEKLEALLATAPEEGKAPEVTAQKVEETEAGKETKETKETKDTKKS